MTRRGRAVHTDVVHRDRADSHARVTALLAAGLDAEAASLGARRTSEHATSDRYENGGSMDPLVQLATLGPLLGGVVADIRPDQLDHPTPCAGFTVRDVLAHMISGATAFAAAYRGEGAPAPAAADDVLAEFGPALGHLAHAMQAPGALQRDVDAPFGTVDGESFARYIVLDGLVHGWDVAIATGHAYDPPLELVAAADAYAHGMLDPLRDGVTFAAAVPPPPDGSPLERLVAFTGRQPRPS